MKNVFQTVLVLSLLTALVACPTTPPTNPSPPIDETPITTAFGTPVGNAVTQTLDANGGTFSEPTTGVTVKAFSGGFDASAQVSVQPITDTLPDGIGMGVAISSSQPLKKPLIVRFSYGADEPDPGSLRLALQTDVGSWLSLAPVKIDTVNKTVSAALPESLAATGTSSQVSLKGSLSLKRVVKYLSFYMKPANATVKVGKSVEFVPWARVLEKRLCPLEEFDGPDDDLLTPLCPKRIVKAYPFTNDKAGFDRRWKVNGIDGGDSTNGTIKPHPSVGATYTAPAQAPNPSTVEVRFISTDTQTAQNVNLSAKVKIAVDYKVVGNYTSSAYQVCGIGPVVANLSDHVEFNLVATQTAEDAFTMENIQNQDSVQTNFRLTAAAYPGDVVKQNSAADVLNLTQGEVNVNGDNISVNVPGKATESACTYTDKGGISTSDPGGMFDTATGLNFKPAAFVNGTQTVSSPYIYGDWVFTITQL